MSKRVQKIKKENKERIIERYKSLETIKSISSDVGVSDATVKSWLVDWGVFEKDIQEKAVVGLFSNNKDISEIQKITGLSNEGVRKKLKRAGVYKNKYTLDETVFYNPLNKDTAYWIGYICGDGGIYKGRLSLTSKDRQIIEDFKSFMKSNHKIHKSIHKKYKKVVYRISFSNKIVTNTLALIGIKENKSLTLDIDDPDIMVIPDFLRGVIDADGYISKTAYKITITSGSKIFANQLSEAISSLGFLCRVTEREREGRSTVFTVIISRKENVIKFLKFLEYDKKNYSLERKRNRALNLINE